MQKEFTKKLNSMRNELKEIKNNIHNIDIITENGTSNVKTIIKDVINKLYLLSINITENEINLD